MHSNCLLGVVFAEKIYTNIDETLQSTIYENWKPEIVNMYHHLILQNDKRLCGCIRRLHLAYLEDRGDHENTNQFRQNQCINMFTSLRKTINFHLGVNALDYSKKVMLKNGFHKNAKTVLDSFGEIYDGSYNSGQRHGYGVCIYPSGTVYEGTWKMGLRCGRGIMWRKNGTLMYCGEFCDDTFWGFGEYFYID